uniref:Uncharacterized protein n=1 Tax=Knipowitschia caucasica TaxID=637954 RepID=A0AAV2KRD9_KNICA
MRPKMGALMHACVSGGVFQCPAGFIVRSCSCDLLGIIKEFGLLFEILEREYSLSHQAGDETGLDQTQTRLERLERSQLKSG